MCRLSCVPGRGRTYLVAAARSDDKRRELPCSPGAALLGHRRTELALSPRRERVSTYILAGTR